MFDRFVHHQPLRNRLLAGNDQVHIIPAAQAVIGYRQKAIGIRREIGPHDFDPLVDHSQPGAAAVAIVPVHAPAAILVNTSLGLGLGP
jgi:hypothetical protein